MYVRGEASADARSAAADAFTAHCAGTDAATASTPGGRFVSLVKAGAWPHPMTVARTGCSSAVEGLELDAAVMGAAAADVAAASPAAQAQLSNSAALSTSSGESLPLGAALHAVSLYPTYRNACWPAHDVVTDV